jgi:hypothetical protein
MTPTPQTGDISEFGMAKNSRNWIDEDKNEPTVKMKNNKSKLDNIPNQYYITQNLIASHHC